jgi:predicted small secreted protein
MKKLITLFTVIFTLSSLTACNTISGIGKDVAGAGKAVSSVADDTKKEMKKK